MKLSYVAFAVSFAVAAPALADNSSDAAKPPKEKKVCRSEPVTGSIVFRSICHTRDEWASIDADNARRVDDTLGNTRPSGSSRP